jgi:hypothetical protein
LNWIAASNVNSDAAIQANFSGSELQQTCHTRTQHPNLASHIKNRGPADPPPNSPKRLRVVPTWHNLHGLASLSNHTNAPLGTPIFLQHHLTPPVSSLLNTHTSKQFLSPLSPCFLSNQLSTLIHRKPQLNKIKINNTILHEPPLHKKKIRKKNYTQYNMQSIQYSLLVLHGWWCSNMQCWFTTYGESAARDLWTGVCHPVKCGSGPQAQVSLLQGPLEML